jgi:hypothetical protein
LGSWILGIPAVGWEAGREEVDMAS